MKLELHVVDVVDDHKIKMDAIRLKIRKIRKYAIHTEAWYHCAVGSIVTLVAVMIAFSYFYYCLLLYSTMVLVFASVGPRPVYDSDVVYIIFYNYLVHLLFMTIIMTNVT